MKLRYYAIPVIAVLTFTVMVVSCSDEWDKHYTDNTKVDGIAYKSDLSLYDYIKSKEELSTFTKMIQIAGYDTILSTAQTFTVWAPNNSALEGFDLKDVKNVKNVVENHIAHFSYTTSGLVLRTMKMVNDKLFPFQASGDGYSFASEKIVQPNLATANGIVHILNVYIPYRKNFWEYILSTEGLDSLRAYLNSTTVKQLDVAKSFKDGMFVDSIFKYPNLYFEDIAAINIEDSIYTGILPTNEAWKEVYAKVYSCYNLLPFDKKTYSQAALTKEQLGRDLFFKGKIEPNKYGVNDTLFSSSMSLLLNRNGFVNPSRLFADAQMVTMSNGYAYVANKLNYRADESWNKAIKLEAEVSAFGRSFNNFALSTSSGIGTGYQTSGGSYMTAVPTKTTSMVTYFVNFPIPGTLSTKYDIYCVFLPGTIVDATNKKPNKVKFSVSYIDSNGNSAIGYIDKNNISQISSTAANTFTTNPEKIDTMLVAKGFEFSFCNLNINTADLVHYPINVALKVTNVAKDTEKDFDRTLRIDYILLKPVQ